jgi:hypothetical protein
MLAFLGISGRHLPLKIAAPAKQGSPHRWKFSTGQRFAHGFPGTVCMYDYIIKLCRQQAELIQNHENENVRGIGQGKTRHRKYKRLKLGGGQGYDRSSN